MRALNINSYEKLLRAFNIDVRSAPSIPLKGGYLPNDVEIKEGPYGPAYTIGYKGRFEVRKDIWGVVSIWAPDHTYTYTFVSHPLQHIDLDDYQWPEIDEGYVDAVEKYCRKYGEQYLIYGGVIHLFEIAWQLTGFNEFLKMMYTRPSLISRILDGLDKIRFEQAKLLIDAGVDVIVDGDDVGAQTTMIVSPSLWRRFLKPRYKRLADLCHRHGVYFFFHSDGWIEPIIPDLVEIGVDILNPVQPECMDPVKVKRLYGDKLCLEGTISVQRTLPFGSVKEVVNEVKDRIRKLGPTGFILGPTHVIQPDTPIENILALYRAAIKYGSFRR
ncbi:MAG: hypothetical protein DRZ82_04615 [Thermoprotei archaeon]|nr:MAG: hypothetical protein DRZ82_04615 [Thermoprotei archaeon]